MPENGHAIYRTDEEVIKALFQTGGNFKETAKLLKLVDVGELRNRVNGKSELKQALVESREQLKDDAEGVIARTIRGKNKQQAIDAAKWYLPRKAKERGYADVVRNENVNVDLNELIEKARKVPLDRRIDLMDYLDAEPNAE
jgi:hypothetical protein